MTCNMDKEKKVGMMEKPNTLVNFIRVKRMVKVDSNGKMEASMMAILLMVTFKVTVN